MKCSFCGAWEYGKEHAYITMADAEKALDAGRKSGYRIMTLTGGEPAIHPEYCRILKAAHRKGYWTVVTTNGLHLDEEIIKHISAAARWQRVTASLPRSSSIYSGQIRKAQRKWQSCWRN